MRYSLLLVEDDVYLRNVLKMMMEKKGYKVHGVSTGGDCIKLIKKQTVDVVVIDVFLPDCMGADLIKMINQKNEATVVILYSGHDSPPLRLKTFNMGGDDYMPKPISPSELDARIKRFIMLKRDKASNSGVCDLLVLGKFTIPLNEFTLIERKLLEVISFYRFTRIPQNVLNEKLRNKNENSLAVNVYRLNKSFKRLGFPLQLKSIYNQGYILKKTT